MVGFRGSTQEKSTFEIFRFGYGKAVSGKMVPDRVGSEFLYYKKFFRPLSRLSKKITSVKFALAGFPYGPLNE